MNTKAKYIFVLEALGGTERGVQQEHCDGRRVVVQMIGVLLEFSEGAL